MILNSFVALLLFLVLVVIVGVVIIALLNLFHDLTFPNRQLPKLYYKHSTLVSHILKRCPVLTKAFKPNYFIRNPHVQTVLTGLSSKSELEFEREFLLLKDNGVVAMDWLKNKNKLKKKVPIIIVVPGLTGDAQAVSRICELASNMAFRCIVFNKRGHGESPLATPKLQSFGDPLDLRQVVKYIRAKFPHCRLTAIGYSAGSGLLASYLGEYGSSTYLTAAVCVSPGYDTEVMFNKGVNQPYGWLLLYNLKKIVSKHALALSNAIDIDRAMMSSTLREFEENVYCKLYGYDDMHQYWDKNNPNRDIDEISIPLLCINSLDDPICIKENIPIDLFKSLPNFLLVTTEYGGHCGFIEDLSDGPTWADKVSFEYLIAVLEFIEQDEHTQHKNKHCAQSS